MWSQISTAIIETLLHSLWQSAMLYLIILLPANLWNSSKSHSFQPNDILHLLYSQYLLSGVTFFILYTTPDLSILSYSFNSQKLFWLQGHQSIIFVLFGLYLMVLMYKITKTMTEWIFLRHKIKHEISKTNLHIRHFTKVHAFRMGIKRNVSVMLSEDIITPFTVGLIRPLIILPAALINQLTPEETEMILLHELHHIASFDWLKNIFLIVTEHLFFFNPFIRAIIRKARIAMEIASDRMVTDHGYSAEAYANSLLACAKFSILKPSAMSIAAVDSKQHLLKRISIIINPKKLEPNRRRFFLFLFPMLTIIFICTIISTSFMNSQNNELAITRVSTSYPKSNIETPLSQANLNLEYSTPLASVSKVKVVQRKMSANQQKIKTEKTSTPKIHPQQDIMILGPTENEFTIQAATDATEKNQIITTEEIPEEHIRITKAYEPKKINGVVSYQLIWTMTEKTALTDSSTLNVKFDHKQIQ